MNRIFLKKLRVGNFSLLIHSQAKHVGYGIMIYCYLTIEIDTVIINERPESPRVILCHIGPYFIT